VNRIRPRRAIQGVLAGLLLLALLVVGGGVFAAPNRHAGPVLAIIPLDTPSGPLVVDASTRRAFLVEPKADRPNGVVLVLDAESGALLRTTTVGYEPRAAAVDERAGLVFVANAGDTTISVLDARTGAVRRTLTLPSSANPMAMVPAAHHLFIGNLDGSVTMLDSASGRVLRTVTMMSPSHSTDRIRLASDERAGRVYVGDDNVGAVSPPPSSLVGVLDAHDGRLLRTLVVDAFPEDIAIDTRNGHVFVATQGYWPSGAVEMLDGRTGRVLAARTLHGSPAALVVDERVGNAFIAGDDPWGTVSVLDTRQGATVRTVRLAAPPANMGFPPAMAGDRRAGRIYVLSDTITFDGPADQRRVTALSVFDARRATVLRTIQLGDTTLLAPNTGAVGQTTSRVLGVDERSDHVFAVVDGGPVRVPGHWNWLPRWLRDHVPFLPAPTFSIRTVPTQLYVVDPME